MTTPFEPAPGDNTGRYYRAKLPDGSWGLFDWDAVSQYMDHVDTQDDPPHFLHVGKKDV